MTLLPSFNGKERRTGKEILTDRDYLITDVKPLRVASPKFFLTHGWRVFRMRDVKDFKSIIDTVTKNELSRWM